MVLSQKDVFFKETLPEIQNFGPSDFGEGQPQPHNIY
jgi:hypothetical protein